MLGAYIEGATNGNNVELTVDGDNAGSVQPIVYSVNNTNEKRKIGELYFNNEIGTKEFKERVGLAEGYKLASHKFIKRYRNENNISGYFRNTVDILAAQEQRVETRRKNHQEIQDKMYEKGI